MEQLEQASWRTSTHSHPQGEACVEVAPLTQPSAVAVRDSKYRAGGAYVVSRGAWRIFIAHVKDHA